ncbi:4Fe-4S dicluster domain-containing protein [Desulfonatronovibrio magnus]|uniref:4Fe-4S dicluster domain-containing protein n=1 Tax=Desulfonatronovibrio magnus TaxID=698827 RepID=UPI0005EBAC0A|nr:4Fe-4S binding protein [Desulfonatronovibrio magnus]
MQAEKMRRRRFLKRAAASGALLLYRPTLADSGAASSRQSAFLYDSIKCINCGVCEKACKRVNGLPEHASVIYMSQNAAELPVHITRRNSCMQCIRPACVRACPTGATFLRGNGLVSYDPQKCAACGYCVDACPFKHPKMSRTAYFNLRNVWVNRCTSCGACAQACPEDALHFNFREGILDMAKERLVQIKSNYALPDAQLYGEEDLNLIWILAGSPDKYNLPGPTAAAVVDTSLAFWKDIVRPTTLLLSLMATGVLGVTYFFARRNHLKELARLKQSEQEENDVK